VLLLSRTISGRKQLGEIVIRLEVRDWHEEDDYKLALETALGIRQLLRLLPNLRYFVYNTSLPYVPFFPNRPYSLRHLTYISLSTPLNSESKFFNLDELEWLSALPALRSLELTNWWDDMECSSTQGIMLPRISSLSIEGFGAAEPSVLNLVNSCFNLVELKLESSWTYKFGLTLPLIQPQLKSLCLRTEADEPEEDDIGIDDHLSHFTHLTTLDLSYGVLTSRSPVALLGLPHLVKLVLGYSEFEISALLPLMEGKHRLPHLKHITLKYEYFGLYRFDPVSEYSKNLFQERDDFPLFRWTEHTWSDPSQRWHDLIDLELVGRRNGVIIEGTGGAKQALRNYALEKYNLAVAQVHYHFDFSYVHEALQLAALHDVQLPPIGIDLFNRNRDEVESVKVEMKEYQWFALTLRKKDVELSLENLKLEAGSEERMSNEGNESLGK